MATAVETEPADSEPGAPAARRATQIARHIEETVIRRGWTVGESLGSEEDLRRQFGGSRSVLREAVRLVEHHQIARMRRGPNGGLLVCAPDAGPVTQAIMIYLEFVGTSVADLLEARLLLEPIAVGLATDQITEEGIATLRAALDEEYAHRHEPGIPAQDPLHTLLGKLSANPVLHLFIDVLIRLTTRYATYARGFSPAERIAERGATHDAHRTIAESVITGDRARAQTALTAHLEAVAALVDTPREPGATHIGSVVAAPEAVDGPRAKLAEVVAGRIRDDIVARGWQVGTLLGTEPELLERYGVSRAALREAVRLLEYHSVARMRRGLGGGLIITSPEPQASVDTTALFLEFQRVTADDLTVVRNAIELSIVARATTRYTEGDATVAERLFAAVRWPADGPHDHPCKADLFHTELAELAGNPVLSLFLSISIELFRRHATGHGAPLPGDRAADEVEHAHRHILDAILAQDVGVARQRMRNHLDALLPWWH